MKVLVACEFSGIVRDAFTALGHEAWSCDLLQSDPTRWEKMEKAAHFFRFLLETKTANRVAVENPIPHGYAVELIGRKPDQYFQPWEFGHREVKKTGLWLRDLLPLKPTRVVKGRKARVHRIPPGPDRWKERSRTLTGVARAMAQQWGNPPSAGQI